jgi:predicted nucleic acid-binding protein
VIYLLDTNVLSELRRSNADSGVKAWFESVPSSDLYVSTLLVGEVRRGVEKIRRKDPSRARVYEAWLSMLRQEFQDRLVPVSAEIAEEWGRMSVPDPLPVIDGLMAATARVHGFTLVTRNTIDLARTGVPLLNPFSQ